MHTEWYMTALSYTCTTCNAWPGQPCLSRNGNPCALPHAARTDQASRNGWRTAEEVDHGGMPFVPR